MLTKEEETLIALMGFKRCLQNHNPHESSWTNEPHWTDSHGLTEYADEIRKRLYAE